MTKGNRRRYIIPQKARLIEPTIADSLRLVNAIERSRLQRHTHPRLR